MSHSYNFVSTQPQRGQAEKSEHPHAALLAVHGRDRRCSGAGIDDRDGLGIDHSGRDTEDRATRLDARMAVGTVAAFPVAMETIHASYWKTSSRDATTECHFRRSRRVTPRASWDGYHSMSWRKRHAY